MSRALEGEVNAGQGVAVRKVRVVYLITDLELGGAPLVLRDRVIGLQGTGEFEITVVSMKPAGVVGDMIAAAGVEVRSLELVGAASLVRGYQTWGRLLRDKRPHVVDSVLVHANIWATLGKCFWPGGKYIQEVHTLQERPAWHWAAGGMAGGFADGVIAPSPAVLEKMATYGPIECGMVVPNAIDFSRFADAEPVPVSERPWRPENFAVGYVGRFDPVKRLDLLVRAAAMAGTELILMGYGPTEGELRHLAGALGIADKVHFGGVTRTPERWYKSFDCLCLPSSVEAFSLTLAEGLAAGVPVVAARTAVTQWVSGGYARLVPPGSVEALAFGIQEVKKNGGDFDREKAGQKWVREAFSPGKMNERHQKILKNFSGFVEVANVKG